MQLLAISIRSQLQQINGIVRLFALITEFGVIAFFDHYRNAFAQAGCRIVFTLQRDIAINPAESTNFVSS